MQVYTVGGWVRDELLRRQGYPIEPQDRDWVITGATPEQMIAAGFKPVGEDFPVFLHPQTHEEYALARTERKSGHGYKGFVFYASPTVTLKEDLRRRDLTINAIAMDEQGGLHDPWGGLNDLNQRVLRHVSSAFAEDPVRLLRTARFAARFPEFTVAPETQTLLSDIVTAGEADALVPERVGKEFLKAMGEKNPSRFFEVLIKAGYFSRRYPNWKLTEALLARLSQAQASAELILALALSGTPTHAAERIAESLRLPAPLIALIKTTCSVAGRVPDRSSPPDVVEGFLRKTDAIRRPERYADLLWVLKQVEEKTDVDFLSQARGAICSIDCAEIAKAQADKHNIPSALQQARIAAIGELSKKFADEQNDHSDQHRAGDRNLDVPSQNRKVDVAWQPTNTQPL